MPTKKQKNRKKEARRKPVKKQNIVLKTTKDISSANVRRLMISRYLIKILLSILILLLVIFSLKFIGTIGKAIFEPPIPANCTESSIQSTWNTIFLEKADGAVIKTGASQISECDNYFAYKIVGSKAYLLIGSFSSSPYLDANNNVIYVNTTSITAAYGNFTDEYLSILRNVTSIDNLSRIYIIPDYVQQKNRTINEANSEFSSEFNVTSQSWQTYTDEFDNTQYISNEQNSSNNYTYYNFRTVIARYYFGQFDFIRTSISRDLLANFTCRPNWTEKETPCIGSEKKTRYYDDINNCPNATKPSDVIVRCDFNGDGLYGHPSAFNTSITGLSLYINGTAYNPSTNYLNNVTKRVEIKDRNNRILIAFDWPFTSPLDLYSMYFRKQNDNDARGYLIVKGINANKTITVDKKMNNSNAVCIKNQEINSINDISNYCNRSNEHIVECPGSNSGFSCAYDSDNDYFEVSGLTNSAAIEMFYNEIEAEQQEEECIPSWNCTSWTECINFERIRTCTDTNICNTTAGKPAESEACTMPCTPNWQCGNWTPAKCPKTLKQTRTCTDLNNCGTLEDKPFEERACKLPKSSTGKIILIVAIVVIVLILAGLAIWYFLFRKPKLSEEGAGIVSWQAPPTPPAETIVMPTNPPVSPPSQYPQQTLQTSALESLQRAGQKQL